MRIRLPNQIKTKLMLTLMLVLGISIVSFAQSVTGIVTDETGETMIGVTVQVEGDNSRGASTDIDGKYSIQAKSGEVLLFSYIGYKTQSATIVESTVVNMVMTEDSEVLEEVVVVGYGRQRKSDLTGAVATVSSEELVQIATPDVLQAVQGRVAGVDVSAQSGEPGGGVRIRIRGVGTINNSDPLYVVDGFQTNDLSFLNPNDIESMEILKDASATAIYGSRGANGVVLITTKRGQTGKAKFELSTYAGTQQVWRTLPMLNAAEYATLRFEAYENDGTTLDQEGDIYTRLKYVQDNNYEGTNWQDEVLRQGYIRNYTLRVSGGSDKNKYSVTGTYFDEAGTVKNANMNKFFLRFANDLELTNWLNAGLTATYMNDERVFYNRDLYGGVLPVALRADPLAAAWDEPTNNWGRADLSYNNNPARIVDEMKGNVGRTDKIVAMTFAEAQIMDGLTFRTQFGADVNLLNNKAYYPEFFIETDEARDQSSLTETRGRQFSWVWSNYMTYTKDIGKNNFSVMAGLESQQSVFQSNSVTGFDVPADEDLRFLSAAKSVDFIVNSNQSDESLSSYFGRLNYSYDGKYLLTVNLRYDGSSRFLPENRWGFFPSFSAGWNVGREAFMENIEAISSMKLRAGYGQVGNQNSAPNYGYVTTITQNQLYVFNDAIVQGFIPTQLSNPELRWETTQMTNFGIDAGFWEDRILFTADYFVKQTSDMIVNVPIPVFIGAAAPRVNAGDMENRGIELSLNYRNFDNDVKYQVGVNFARIGNQVTSLGGGEPIAGGFVGPIGSVTRTEVGYEIAYFYGLQTDGIFNDQAELDAYTFTDENGNANPIQPNAQPGDVKFLDLNGDGAIDDNDRTYLGSGTPDYTFGINGQISYKGFDVSVFFQGVQGNEIVNSLSQFVRASNGFENSTADRLDRWTTDNTSSNVPRMTDQDPNGNYATFSDLFVEDGSYIRLKNAQIGYTLPKDFISKARLGSVRVYVAGDNLLTWTDYSGFDPEIGELFFDPLAYGVDQATYPQARRVRFGLDIRF